MKWIFILLLMLMLAEGGWSLLIGSTPIEEALSISKLGNNYLVLVSSPYGSGENLTLSSVIVELTPEGKIEEMIRPLPKGDPSLTSITSKDERILAVGNIVNARRMRGILIEKTARGWFSHILNVSESNIQEIKPIKDGFLLAGGITTLRGDWDILLIKLNDELKIDWAVQIGDRSDNMVYDIATNGSDIYLLGPSSVGIMVICMSLNGSIKWARSFFTEKYLKGKSITVGRYIAITGSIPYWMHRSDAFLILLNSSGFAKMAEIIKGNGANSLNDIAWDGKFYWAVGRTNCYTAGGCDAWVIQFSSLGSVRESRKYGWRGIDGANALLIDGDRKIVVGQSEGRNRESQFGDAFIMMIENQSSCVPSMDRAVQVSALKIKDLPLNLNERYLNLSLDIKTLEVKRSGLRVKNPCSIDIEFVFGISILIAVSIILILALYVISRKLK